jgi:hypothetical protein
MPKAPCYLTIAATAATALLVGGARAEAGFAYAYAREDCAPQGGTAITIVLARTAWSDELPPVPHYRVTVYSAELRAGQMVWFDKTPFSDRPAGAAVRCEARGCVPVDARLRVIAVERGRRIEGLLIPATGPRREDELSLPFSAQWRPGRPVCG